MSLPLCWWHLQRIVQSNQHHPGLTSPHHARLEEPQDALSWICLFWYFEELPTVPTPPETQTTYQTQWRFVEVQETAQQAWDVPGHLTPFPSRHCAFGTKQLQPSISDVNTTSHCLATLALTLAHAEDLFAHLTSAEPDTDALSWYYTVLPESSQCLTAVVPSPAARLLFNSGESFPFVPILLSKEEKESKKMPYSSTPQKQCLAGTSHQCFNSVFLHVLNFRNHMFNCGKHTH